MIVILQIDTDKTVNLIDLNKLLANHTNKLFKYKY